MKSKKSKLGEKIEKAAARTALCVFLAFASGCASIAIVPRPELTQLFGAAFFVFLFLLIGFGWRWESLGDQNRLQNEDYQEELVFNNRSSNTLLWALMALTLVMISLFFSTDANAPWKNLWWSLFTLGAVLCLTKTLFIIFRDGPKKTE